MAEASAAATKAQRPPADAVRVWRGFRSAAVSPTDFFARLGTVFIPATVEMQIAAGLSAYIPTVAADLDRKPSTTPDETAILFWESQQAYSDGFKTLAVRTYTLTHAAVYTPASRADFPVPFIGELLQDQPYYLVDQPADWMTGAVHHLIGSRPSHLTPDQFLAAVGQAVGELKQTGGLAGAIVCVGADYLVYWQLGGAVPMELASSCDWTRVFEPQPLWLPAGLWDEWSGLTVAGGDSLNLNFKRR